MGMTGDSSPLLAPVWEGGTIWRETFAMIEENGQCSAPFLYSPEKIIRIESYDGKNVYELGRDCFVKDGRLFLTRDSRIPQTGWETFYTSQETPSCDGKPGPDFGPVRTTDGKFLNLSAVGNPEYITRWQLAVTYTTQGQWQGFRPVSGIERLPRLYGRLKRKEPVKIVLYGDSISCGCDCSGLYGLEPGQPQWSELLIDSLRDYYGGSVEFINTSVGGTDSEWALENAGERAISHQPDLVLLGFGMNDRCPGGEYREKTERLLRKIAGECPDTEYVLIATTLPNPLAHTAPMYFSAHQEEYAQSLYPLAGAGVVVADVQRVQKELMKRKRYIDITGNLLNHPNDYLARIQGQVLDTVLKP